MLAMPYAIYWYLHSFNLVSILTYDRCIACLYPSESDPRIGTALRSLGISASSIVAAVIIMVPKLLEVEAIGSFVKSK